MSVSQNTHIKQKPSTPFRFSCRISLNLATAFCVWNKYFEFYLCSNLKILIQIIQSPIYLIIHIRLRNIIEIFCAYRMERAPDCRAAIGQLEKADVTGFEVASETHEIYTPVTPR